MENNRRIQNYKNKGNTADELRRRREEEGVQLRKTKREEQVRGGAKSAGFRRLYSGEYYHFQHFI